MPAKSGRPEDIAAQARKDAIRFKPSAVVGTFAPVPELIREMEGLLELAKTGKLRAAAWAVVYHDDSKPDGEVASGWARGPFTAFGLTAAIERLVFRWKKHEYE